MSATAVYTRSEVSLHNSSENCWIIISGKVYNVTQWLDTHPGGRDILQYHGGQDATIPFHSFHSNMKKATSYMKSYYIGDLVPEERELPAIDRDFMKLRRQLIKEGLFKPNPYYFVSHFLLALSLEAIAAALLYNYTNSWIVWCVAVIIVVIAQGFGIELNHNTGHRCLFRSVWLNKLCQGLSMGVLDGYSSSWWSDHHTLHHVKTNLYDKDPYISSAENTHILLGTILPKKWGRERKGSAPFQYQHYYGTPWNSIVVMTLYFNYDGLKFAIKNWLDIICINLFVTRWYFLFYLSLGGVINFSVFLLTVKIVFYIWYVSITQTNHSSMEVQVEDKSFDWVTLHLTGTCNVTSNWFTDWFTANLNFQIEHHLFPDLPPYNSHLVQPHVQALCQKYNIDYQVKPFFKAFKDVYVTFKRSGQIWWNEYQKTTKTND